MTGLGEQGLGPGRVEPIAAELGVRHVSPVPRGQIAIVGRTEPGEHALVDGCLVDAMSDGLPELLVVEGGPRRVERRAEPSERALAGAMQAEAGVLPKLGRADRQPAVHVDDARLQVRNLRGLLGREGEGDLVGIASRLVPVLLRLGHPEILPGDALDEAIRASPTGLLAIVS